MEHELAVRPTKTGGVEVVCGGCDWTAGDWRRPGMSTLMRYQMEHVRSVRADEERVAWEVARAVAERHPELYDVEQLPPIPELYVVPEPEPEPYGVTLRRQHAEQLGVNVGFGPDDIRPAPGHAPEPADECLGMLDPAQAHLSAPDSIGQCSTCKRVVLGGVE